jgi:alanine-glyoxylate transaminase/serine-glyoxylate transaminase/serine-pyruvate transaminase
VPPYSIRAGGQLLKLADLAQFAPELLGALNELEVLGTLGGVEMALAEAGVPIELGSGVAAAQRSFVAGRQAVATPVVAAAR